MHLIGPQHRLGGAECLDLAPIQPQRHITQMANVVRAMRAKQDGAATFAEGHDALDAFFLEMLVPHGQGLVDDQQLRLYCRHQGKCQAHRHTRRIGLDRAVNGITQLGELDDAGLQALHLGAGNPNKAAAKVQVVAATEVRVEAGPQLQNGGDPAHSGDTAYRRLHGARHHLQQRTLAGAVVTNHPQTLTAVQFK